MIFSGLVTCRDFIPVGVITATSFDFDSGTSTNGRIRVGIATIGTLNVGTGSTVLLAQSASGISSVGINSTAPQATLDIDGRAYSLRHALRELVMQPLLLKLLLLTSQRHRHLFVLQPQISHTLL